MATSAPRAQAEVRFAKDGTGSVETVYLRGHSGVKILGRWYDKGLEAGSAPRGLLIRAEDQRRYPHLMPDNLYYVNNKKYLQISRFCEVCAISTARLTQALCGANSRSLRERAPAGHIRHPTGTATPRIEARHARCDPARWRDTTRGPTPYPQRRR